MTRACSVLIGVLAIGSLGLSGNGPSQWQTLDKALAWGARTGQPICVFAMVDQEGKSP